MKKTIKRRNIRRRRRTQKGKGLLPNIFKKNKIHPDNAQHNYTQYNYSQQASLQNRKKPSSRGRKHRRRTYNRSKYSIDNKSSLPESWYTEYYEKYKEKNVNTNPNPNPNKSESKSTM